MEKHLLQTFDSSQLLSTHPLVFSDHVLQVVMLGFVCFMGPGKHGHT